MSSWILKDIECPFCGIMEVLSSQGQKIQYCEQCGSEARVIPSFGAIVGLDSFNSHYDIQLGKFFESAEHKEKTLQEMGRVQVSGNPSPRKSRQDRIIMTKSQYERGIARRTLLRSRNTKEKPNVRGNDPGSRH